MAALLFAAYCPKFKKKKKKFPFKVKLWEEIQSYRQILFVVLFFAWPEVLWGVCCEAGWMG